MSQIVTCWELWHFLGTKQQALLHIFGNYNSKSALQVAEILQEQAVST